jgi:hypothetical protein
VRQWSTGVLGRLTNFERFRDQHTLRARRVIVARWFGRILRTFIYASRHLDHRCRKRCMENNGSDQCLRRFLISSERHASTSSARKAIATSHRTPKTVPAHGEQAMRNPCAMFVRCAQVLGARARSRHFLAGLLAKDYFRRARLIPIAVKRRSAHNRDKVSKQK